MAGMATKTKKAKGSNQWPGRLRAIRHRLRMTQTEAGAKVGVTQRAWLAWETGAALPSRQSAILIEQLILGNL